MSEVNTESATPAHKQLHKMGRRTRAESWRSGRVQCFLRLDLGCQSHLLLRQIALRTHLSFSTFPGSLPPLEEARSPLIDIPPHPLSFLASLEEQNTVTLMQKDVTLHSQEVKGGFEQHSAGASKFPLFNCTGTRKEVTTHTLWGYAYSCTSAPALQAHGNTYILWMNSGQFIGMLILKFWPHRETPHLDAYAFQSRSDPHKSMHVVIGFFNIQLPLGWIPKVLSYTFYC